MKHMNDGFVLPEYACRARLGEAGVLSVATGKRHSEKAGLVCLAGRNIKLSNHNARVTAVTYSCYFTLIMCGYFTSRWLNSRQDPLPGRFEFDSGRISATPKPAWKNPKKRSLVAARNGSRKQGPIAVKGQIRTGGIRAAAPSNSGTHATTTGQAIRDQSQA
jgi:hypothetical protein